MWNGGGGGGMRDQIPEPAEGGGNQVVYHVGLCHRVTESTT